MAESFTTFYGVSCNRKHKKDSVSWTQSWHGKVKPRKSASGVQGQYLLDSKIPTLERERESNQRWGRRKSQGNLLVIRETEMDEDKLDKARRKGYRSGPAGRRRRRARQGSGAGGRRRARTAREARARMRSWAGRWRIAATCRRATRRRHPRVQRKGRDRGPCWPFFQQQKKRRGVRSGGGSKGEGEGEGGEGKRGGVAGTWNMIITIQYYSNTIQQWHFLQPTC
jgi:hypothetical protein